MGNSAIVTRCWRFPSPTDAIVELRHEYGHVACEYQLLCDGELVHSVKATTLDILELAFTLSYAKCGGSGVREEAPRGSAFVPTTIGGLLMKSVAPQRRQLG